MQITGSNQLLELNENEFVGEVSKMTNSQINFYGKNNILVCEDDVHLWNSIIDSNLDNSVLYLSSNISDYSVNIPLHNNNVCFIGKNNFFNGRTSFVLSESENISLDDECFISYNVVFRTSDRRPIYNDLSKKRMNWSKSIYGNHVRFGQNAMIFKKSKTGSGSIIGVNSVVLNKKILSNTTYAGALLRLIHENTFWTPHSVHGWWEEEIEKMSESNSDLFSYSSDENTWDSDDIEERLNSSDSDDEVEYVSMFLFAGKNHFT